MTHFVCPFPPVLFCSLGRDIQRRRENLPKRKREHRSISSIHHSKNQWLSIVNRCRTTFNRGSWCSVMMMTSRINGGHHSKRISNMSSARPSLPFRCRTLSNNDTSPLVILITMSARWIAVMRSNLVKSNNGSSSRNSCCHLERRRHRLSRVHLPIISSNSNNEIRNNHSSSNRSNKTETQLLITTNLPLSRAISNPPSI